MKLESKNNTRGNLHIFLPFLTGAFIVLLQLPMLLMPISPPHSIRQADTAAVARNFTIDSPGLFYPRVDFNQGTSGITGMEFPLYQYVAGLFYRFVPLDQDWPGKLLSMLAGLGTAFFLIRLLKPHAIAPPVVLSVLYALPAMFFYTVKFIPEASGLFFMVFGLYHYRIYRDSGSDGKNTRSGILALLGLTLGSLIRPYFIFLNLPLVIDFIKLLFQKEKAKRRFAADLFLGGLFILAVFTAWYFYWSPRLVREFGLDYFFTGHPLKENLALLITVDFWLALAWRLFEDYLNWIMVPFLGIGIWRAKKDGLFQSSDSVLLSLAYLPWLTIGGIILLTGRHFSPHFYYFFPAIPGLAFFLAVGLNPYFTSIYRKKPVWGFVLLLFLIGAAAGSASQNYTKSKLYALYAPIQSELKRINTPDTLFVVQKIDGSAFSLHPARLRGWSVSYKSMMNEKNMQYFRDKGADYVVVSNQDQNRPMTFYTIGEWLNIIAP